MAFNLQALENHSGSGAGLKLWSYNAGADNRAAVNGSGYFNPAYGLLNVGDVLTIRASDHVYHARVSAKTGGAITIAALSSFA